DAPEVLEIKVLAVAQKKQPDSIRVDAKARVVRVKRSRTGLKPGRVIALRYEHYLPSPGWVGPRPVPIVRPGRVYPAYLVKAASEAPPAGNGSKSAKGAKVYVPAARGYSFEEMKP
ncbi:MAG: hypothetical protein KY468_07765, partial [Armatimonadetes bacterium]|nr:hypothetical protein [Armatimonadota bacterium]